MAVADKDAISQRKLQDQVVKELEKLAGKTFNDDDITFEGQRFVLPEGSTLADGARFLAKKAKEYEEETSFVRRYTFRPWDVSYNMIRAFKRLFGSVSHGGSWLRPPTMVEIPDGPDSVVQVPQGTFQIPHLPDVTFVVGSDMDDEWGMIGYVHASGPKRLSKAINAVFDVIQQELETNSLYRGKAIVHGDMPRFLPVDKIDPSRIVYAAEVQDAIDTHIMARLDYPEVLEQLGISFRSKILAEGEFGVGKTELLNLAAKRAAAREITFILVPKDQQHDLVEAMRTARMYAPAVVAFEDVDIVGSAEAEASRVSQVLDAFDGGQAKLNQVMVLLTTNHVDALHKGMVRPGRIDAIIHIAPPDAEGIQKIIEANIPAETIDPEMRWAEVATAMEGYHPAFVVEAASRAMRYAVVRSARANNGKPSAEIVVSTEDLKAAGYELKRQWDIHRGAKTQAEERPLDEALVQALLPAVGERVERAVERVVAERLNEQVASEGYAAPVNPEKLPRQMG